MTVGSFLVAVSIDVECDMDATRRVRRALAFRGVKPQCWQA